MNGAIWRFHPKTKKFELFAEGTSNPWGMDWRNTDGQFILACCVIPHLYHIVPGGIYKRQAGSSYNPFVYGYINEISDHTFHKESGWAHAGLISLDVPHIPEKYRNSVIFGSIHGCSIKQNILKPKGSSYVASRGDDFLVSGDKNVRPINMKWGPHGDIYLIDWHDQNPCHQAAAGSWDYERGRVYRIQLKDRKGGKAEDLGAASNESLLTITADTDPYRFRTALRLLSSRDLKITRDESKSLDESLEKSPGRKHWIMNAAGIDVVQGGKRRGGESWRVLSRPGENAIASNNIAYYSKLIAEEDAAVARRDFASAALWSATQIDVTPLLHALMKRQEDASDPLIPQLVWLAYEKTLFPSKALDSGDLRPRLAKELEFLAKEAPDNIFVRDGIVPKVMRRLVATNKPEGLALCLKFVNDVSDLNTREKALDGLTIALAGRAVPPPATWLALQTELRKEPKFTALVNKLAVSFRDPAAAKRAYEAVMNGTTIDIRVDALRDLVLLQHPEASKLISTLLRDDKEPLRMRQEAARHLTSLNAPKLTDAIISDWAKFPKEIQVELLGSLAGRKESAKALLQAMKDKKVDRILMTDNTVIKMQAFNDKDINTLIETAWGRSRPTPAELTKLIDKTRAELGETPASFARGKLIFENQCAKCHKFDGKGVEVGPQLDGAGRDIEYLLANVIDPNRVIGAPYFLRTVTTLDGRVEQGLLVEEDANAITLKVENAQLKKFQKKDLDGPVKVQEKSMMPEGLTTGMTPQNFRDLLRYVMANPFIADVSVNGKAMSVGVPGRIPLSAGKEIAIEASFTATDVVKTKLLISAMTPFTIALDGKPLANGSEGFDVELAKGKHTLTIKVMNAAEGHALYARFLDPNRLLRYADE